MASVRKKILFARPASLGATIDRKDGWPGREARRRIWVLGAPRVGFTRGVFRPVVLPRGAFDFLGWPLVLSFPSFSSLARLSSGVGEMLVSPEPDSGCHAGLWSAH